MFIERQLTAIIHSAPTAGGGGELARYDYTYTASERIRQSQPRGSVVVDECRRHKLRHLCMQTNQRRY